MNSDCDLTQGGAAPSWAHNPASVGSTPTPAPTVRKVCMDCGAELPGSNPQAAQVSHGLCQVDFERRMAELRAA